MENFTYECSGGGTCGGHFVVLLPVTMRVTHAPEVMSVVDCVSSAQQLAVRIPTVLGNALVRVAGKIITAVIAPVLRIQIARA